MNCQGFNSFFLEKNNDWKADIYLSVFFDKHPEKNYTKIKGIEFHTFALKFEEVTLGTVCQKGCIDLIWYFALKSKVPKILNTYIFLKCS